MKKTSMDKRPLTELETIIIGSYIFLLGVVFIVIYSIIS